MAELYVLGYIHGATKFSNKTSLFCRYSFQSGPNWTILSGISEGQTSSALPGHNASVEWTHPIDVHFITKGVQGWPKLQLQVSCLDALGRSWIDGYSCCSLPSVPGHHIVDLPCWAPTAINLTDRIKQYFLGGSHQLLQTDIVGLGADRYKLKTESKGNIQLHIDIILRNFSNCGVEYK